VSRRSFLTIVVLTEPLGIAKKSVTCFLFDINLIIANLIVLLLTPVEKFDRYYNCMLLKFMLQNRQQAVSPNIDCTIVISDHSLLMNNI